MRSEPAFDAVVETSFPLGDEVNTRMTGVGVRYKTRVNSSLPHLPLLRPLPTIGVTEHEVDTVT